MPEYENIAKAFAPAYSAVLALSFQLQLKTYRDIFREYSACATAAPKNAAYHSYCPEDIR